MSHSYTFDVTWLPVELWQFIMDLAHPPFSQLLHLRLVCKCWRQAMQSIYLNTSTISLRRLQRVCAIFPKFCHLNLLPYVAEYSHALANIRACIDIKELSVASCALSEIGLLCSMPWSQRLKRITFQNHNFACFPAAIEGLGLFTHFVNLQRLVITNMAFTASEIQKLALLTQLECVSLVDCVWPSASLDHLSSLTRLSTLRLAPRSAHINRDSKPHCAFDLLWLTHIHKLTDLDLNRHDSVPSVDYDAVELLAELTQLERLSISLPLVCDHRTLATRLTKLQNVGAVTERVGRDSIIDLGSLPCHRHLPEAMRCWLPYIRSYLMLSTPFDVTADIQLMTALTSLSADSCQLPPAVIATCSFWSSLRSIRLNQTAFGDFHLFYRMTALEALVIVNSPVYDDSALVLTADRCSRLRSICISGYASNRLRDVRPLSKLTALTELELSGLRSVDDDHLRPLLQNMPWIRSLNCEGCSVRGAALADAACRYQLTDLTLFASSLSEFGARAVATRFPSLLEYRDRSQEPPPPSVLAALLTNAHWEELDLTALGDSHIPLLCSCTTLRRLTLTRPNLTHQDLLLPLVSSLRRLESLQLIAGNAKLREWLHIAKLVNAFRSAGTRIEFR